MIVVLIPVFSPCGGFRGCIAPRFPLLCAAQASAPAPANPRAPADDPRIGLKPGLYDAGEASFGLEQLLACRSLRDSLPKLRRRRATAGAASARAGQPPRLQLGSTNSDLAFSGNHLFVGNYNGINFYDIDNPKKIKLRTSLLCPGGQGDVSVYGHLLFMSAEAMNGRIDCGTQGIPLPPGYTPPPPPPPPGRDCRAPPGRASAPPPPPSPDRFRGVRIFDISEFRIPSRWPRYRAAAARTRTRW